MVFQTQSFETISTEIYLLEKFQHQFCFHTPQSFCFISDGIHSARSPGSWESCMPSPRGTELCQSMENSTHLCDLTRKMNNTGKSSTKPKLFFKNSKSHSFYFCFIVKLMKADTRQTPLLNPNINTKIGEKEKKILMGNTYI